MSGLYIHIPFCSYKCTYCNFFSVVHYNDKDIYKLYLDSLLNEYNIRIKDYNNSIDTIYIGGGTPSIIGASLIEYLFNGLEKIINLNSLKEITIEFNINEINNDTIKVLEAINNIRLSIGLQTFNEKSLSIINRHTDKNDIIKALETVQKSKLENISVDFISALPLNSINTTKEDILLAYKLLPKMKHISLYDLELTDALIKRWNEYLPTIEDSVIYYDIASATIEELGFNRYEISNYAILGFESIHNSNYWDLKEYIGIGVSACGFYNNVRYENIRVINDYINSIKENNLAIKYSETLDDTMLKKEFIFLSLRTIRGLDLIKYTNMFNSNFLKDYSTILKNYEYYFSISNNFISIKREYLHYVDEISLLFF